MKIILLKDVRGVGHQGDVKEVADGYASNALFPKKLAEPATDEKIKQHAAQAAARVAEVKKEEEQLDAKVASLHGKGISLSSRATEKGGLFKTISAADITKAIRAEHSIEIPEANVHIATPIKTIGEHRVIVQSKNQKAELTVVVTKSA
jgi:large subunit ribosomal protein L9